MKTAQIKPMEYDPANWQTHLPEPTIMVTVTREEVLELYTALVRVGVLLPNLHEDRKYLDECLIEGKGFLTELLLGHRDVPVEVKELHNL